MPQTRLAGAIAKVPARVRERGVGDLTDYSVSLRGRPGPPPSPVSPSRIREKTHAG